MPLNLIPPDWDGLEGGTEEAAWLADRNRKARILGGTMEQLQGVYSILRERGALYNSSPEILRTLPFAGDWYVSLAAFSLKTLRNVREQPATYGLIRSPAGMIKSLANNPQAPSDEDIAAFSAWVNDQIETVYPPEGRNDVESFGRVAAILGGRVIGRGQNKGGSEAVFLVKALLVDGLAEEFGFECSSDGVIWRLGDPEEIEDCTMLRFGGRLICDFRAGGDRPDIKMSVGDEVLAVGEIKGRKDLSNLWESWMPQVADHMRTWAGEYPEARRLFFGTIITKEMIIGKSVIGTERTGLRDVYEDDRLSAAYNLSPLTEGSGPDAPLRNLVEELARILREA